ncbi:basic leucine zipper transcriptional factor ATF-like 3 isoform X4 [Rhinatrema bivittatum]|uniref:basic leucine zipper transcriptional factor ATF-like 3 isoform X4 n=1 Tax=Rhinatrema bivittatum TaxID=194408 RepID=UPI00112BEA95|nr:basic leucine zipper transcriptional factor ATF-like 3 isoform X4 [Rhinatrema bivittatum]XP_029449098.1 basic leucine zipper transcriptional factor ATF-like 3 isoform X4 [Rhinatrema bivittatum]
MCPALRLPLPRPLPAALSWSSGMSHLAASDSRRGSTSSSEQDLQTQSPSSDRKVRRREKNRVAAQRSRKKQTQKADKLHELPPARFGFQLCLLVVHTEPLDQSKDFLLSF